MSFGLDDILATEVNVGPSNDVCPKEGASPFGPEIFGRARAQDLADAPTSATVLMLMLDLFSRDGVSGLCSSGDAQPTAAVERVMALASRCGCQTQDMTFRNAQGSDCIRRGHLHCSHAAYRRLAGLSVLCVPALSPEYHVHRDYSRRDA